MAINDASNERRTFGLAVIRETGLEPKRSRLLGTRVSLDASRRVLYTRYVCMPACCKIDVQDARFDSQMIGEAASLINCRGRSLWTRRGGGRRGEGRRFRSRVYHFYEKKAEFPGRFYNATSLTRPRCTFCCSQRRARPNR